MINKFVIIVQISIYFFFFFFNCLALYNASFLFQVNSPNLKPIIHLFTFLLCQDFPEYTLTEVFENILGITDERDIIFFSAFLKMGCCLYKNIFFQKKGEQKINFMLELNCFKNLIYLNLVVLPQGVLGYRMDFVRPPCG